MKKLRTVSDWQNMVWSLSAQAVWCGLPPGSLCSAGSGAWVVAAHPGWPQLDWEGVAPLASEVLVWSQDI